MTPLIDGLVALIVGHPAGPLVLMALLLVAGAMLEWRQK